MFIRDPIGQEKLPRLHSLPFLCGGWEGSDVCVDVCMRKEKLERVALIIKRCSLGNHRMDGSIGKVEND